MAATEYTVKLPIFEGPLDLLLHLIKVNEMEVSEISISEITQQYLDYLRLMETLDLEVAGEFLVMAATLIHIKLRALLPDPEEEIEEAEEELDDFMTARQLMQRLIEYRKFKEAARGLGDRAERQSQVFMREVALPKLAEAEEEPAVRGDLDLLLAAFARVIKFVDRRDFHEVRPEQFMIDEKVMEMRAAIREHQRMSLHEIFKACRAKLEMIVTLVALLELCRLHEVRLSQTGAFDDVHLFLKESEADLVDKAEQADAMDRIEAEIIAGRTGLVDDGDLGQDEEDAMIEAILSEDPAEAEAEAEGEAIETDTEDADTAPPTSSDAAEVIELAEAPADDDGDVPPPQA